MQEIIDCRLSDDIWDAGRYYTGQMSHTAAMQTCQAWTEQTPHNHTFTSDKNFPDKDIEGLIHKKTFFLF